MDSKVEKRSESPPQTESYKTTMAMIRLLLLVVLLGYAMLWVMAPTSIYWKTWFPSIREKVKYAIYGTQGATLLLYTFPILFVAVLGCLYLHLAKKSNDYKMESNGKKHRLSTWRRPMLVKAPLGIVSGVEVAFLVMFMALLIWSFATYLRNYFATITPQSAAENGEKVWEAKLEGVAFWLGVIGNICLTLLFFPVARGSSVLPLFGLTSESTIKYHIWLGHLVMVFFTAHGVGYIIYWIVTNQASEPPLNSLVSLNSDSLSLYSLTSPSPSSHSQSRSFAASHSQSRSRSFDIVCLRRKKMVSIEIDSAQIDDDTVNMEDEDDVVEIQDNDDKATIPKTKRSRKTTSTVWNYFELLI